MDILFGRGNPAGQIGEGPGQSHGTISSTQRQLLRGQGTIDQFHRLERGVRMQPRAGCLSITCPPELLEPIFGGVSLHESRVHELWRWIRRAIHAAR